ncbi:hypothetical protein BGW36DRAFT_362518 [Talaromyces proteolyticus]|uniref:Fungal STAND N-terminal Goodbye domain-containing protein n=1 Tax=Talaromyces proteolyticus TaxID=1131652 RepID=A0AAD4KPA1_9EURO|nr:uncharacterized protein BGW36DRAFT_362518 [Talaromyces proteolyticus]KAH8692976.1 hypothetical protein BGW36DRAFT_362518 [Talaromyces proteolyticus]
MATSRPTQLAPLSTAEEELKKMWEEAEREFNQLTRKNLRTDHEKGLDDVLQEFERKYQPPQGGKQSGLVSKEKIKKTIANVLNCIQLLGGIAAQGASIVFGPATLCFNAISFLIDVPGKIAHVYEGIESLFDEISHFLSLFKVYRQYDRLDSELKDGTHKLMMSMVRICGLSIKIIDGGVMHRIKIGMKVTFLNDDSGVSAELVKFKDLIEKQSRVTGAITLQHVLESENGIAKILQEAYVHAEQLSSIDIKMDSLVADMTDRKTQKITTGRVDTVARMLSKTTEPIQEAKQALQTLRDGLLTQSAQWLLQDQRFTDWKSPNSDLSPLLVLSGGPKTGKSHLLAAIERDLRTTNTGVSIAYYAFSEHDTKSTKDKNKNEIIDALKSMALQLAAQHTPYAKQISGIKDFQPPEGGKNLEKQWWEKLLFSNIKSSRPDEEISIVLIFDGLDALKENATKLEKLLNDVQQPGRTVPQTNDFKLRIIATGDWDDSQVFVAGAKPIQIVTNNKPAIEAYINHELEKDEILQGQHFEMVELLKSIRENLPEKANGSFAVVQQKLERIREAVESNAYLDDTEQILEEDPAKDHGKIARKALSDLNTALQAQEIEQLNELLNWVIFGYEYFGIDHLRAALFLNTGRSPLQPFEKTLKNKYMKIFYLRGDVVDVDSDIEELFRNESVSAIERPFAPDAEGAKISMTVSINQADLRNVQQFFWDLTERVGISRFDFLETKEANDGKGVIHCEEVQAHYHISRQLLKLLNDEPHDKTKCLVKYALGNLPEHLQRVKEALDKNKLGAVERKAIAGSLVDLLSDVEGTGNLWNTSSETYSCWIRDSGVETIQNWLNDTETLKTLEPREKRWVRKHTAKSEGKAGFYKPITLMLARRWLQSRGWNPYAIYEWIDRFIELQKSEDDKKESDTADNDETASNGDASSESSDSDDTASDGYPSSASSDGDDETTSSEDTDKHSNSIPSAATWVQQMLNLRDDDLNSLWYERIGEAYYHANKYEEARNYFETAKKFPESSWSVVVNWTMAVSELSEKQPTEAEKKEMKESACKEMESALTYLRARWKDNRDDMTIYERESFIPALKHLASWQEELQMIDRTVELYKEALVVDPQDIQTYFDLLKILFKHEKREDAREVLTRILKPSDELRDPDIFTLLLREITTDEYNEDNLNVANFLVNIAQTDNTLTEKTLEGFSNAIQDARNNDWTMNEGLLLLYQGILQARSTTESARLQHAINSWEECQSLYLTSNWDLINTRHFAARFVTQHYFNQAVRRDHSAEEREQHLNKLLKLSRLSQTWNHGFRPTSFLASYYVMQGRQDEARKLFRNEMIDALCILTDSDPDNDPYGYKYLADLLMHTGDDLNSLIAWSKLSPSVCREFFRLNCDGRCGLSWTHANELYICRYCPDTQFSPACVEKLRENQLDRFICHRDHEWLYVPAWTEENVHGAGEDAVWVPSDLPSDENQGRGNILSKDDWLKGIRETWGISEEEIRGAS